MKKQADFPKIATELKKEYPSQEDWENAQDSACQNDTSPMHRKTSKTTFESTPKWESAFLLKTNYLHKNSYTKVALKQEEPSHRVYRSSSVHQSVIYTL